MTDDKTTPNPDDLTTKARTIYLLRSGWKPVDELDHASAWVDPHTQNEVSAEVAERVAMKRQTVVFAHWLHRLPDSAEPFERAFLGYSLLTFLLGALKAYLASPGFADDLQAWLADADVQKLKEQLRTLVRPILRDELALLIAEYMANVRKSSPFGATAEDLQGVSATPATPPTEKTP